MNNYQRITDAIITLAQSKETVAAVDAVMLKLYTIDEKELYSSLSMEVRDTLLASYQAEKIDTKDKTQVQTYLQGLKDYLTKLPTVTLKVAFQPTSKHIEEMSDWLRKNVEFPLLLDVQIDPSTIAGAVIKYNGVFKNYSLGI